MDSMNIAVLHDGEVGIAIRDYLFSIPGLDLHSCHVANWRESYDDLGVQQAPSFLRDLKPDWLILAWFPKIIHHSVIASAKHTLNVHNSLLPFCRGKHPNFWSIVEGVPYGVSLHSVTPNVDDGEIYSQQVIEYDWTDTGETLHRKSLEAAVQLFKRDWPAIAAGELQPKPQKGWSTYHNAIELDDASRIPNGATTGLEVLNVIRARQAYGHSAWFVDRGVKYNVTVKIERAPG